ncbi:hypothetical protein JVU11DRAFT_9619 [Chiua virens]|nr:hypothetical protein JVU11DRAFT_9619 [Chiua virens]
MDTIRDRMSDYISQLQETIVVKTAYATLKRIDNSLRHQRHPSPTSQETATLKSSMLPPSRPAATHPPSLHVDEPDFVTSTPISRLPATPNPLFPSTHPVTTHTNAMRALLRAQARASETIIIRLSEQASLFGLVRSLGDHAGSCFVVDVPWNLPGTRFGLTAPGVKVENALLSMLPEARWEYRSELGAKDQDTEEAQMVRILKEPRNWVD